MGHYHEGEIEAQARAGVREMAERVGRSIRETIPPAAAAFLAEQPIVVAAGRDGAGRVWASLLVGPPGFLRPLDERTLRIAAEPPPGDPLCGAFIEGAPIGLVAIELATRRRMRLNGAIARRGRGELVVRADEVYSNCPKYIQARELEGAGGAAPAGRSARRSAALEPGQRRWIEAADTFFVASAHPERGADASHRGGPAGFARLDGHGRIVFPDYAGNTMLQTLGNITASPAAGLLFIDFERGATLQVTGRARIVWDAEETARHPGAERLVVFEPGEVVETSGAHAVRWGAPEPSPFNPR